MAIIHCSTMIPFHMFSYLSTFKDSPMQILESRSDAFGMPIDETSDKVLSSLEVLHSVHQIKNALVVFCCNL